MIHTILNQTNAEARRVSGDNLTLTCGRMSYWLSWVFFWYVEYYVLKLNHWIPSGPETQAVIHFDIQWQGIAFVPLCAILGLMTRALEQQGDRQICYVW